MVEIHPLTWLGVALMLIGIAFVLLPVIGRYVDLSSIPSWLIYVYRSDGFYFVTSPLLIAISIVAIIFHFLTR